MGNEVILQEKITLDDAMDALETFPNGCNFKLIFDGPDCYLTWGCYGVHLNLTSGKERLLMQWLGDQEKKLLPIHPKTKTKLLQRKPCEVCGGDLHKDVRSKEDG